MILQMPVVIYGKNTDSLRLDDTMYGRELKSGRYLANIIADGVTSCVVFVVEGRYRTADMPYLKDVHDILKFGHVKPSR